jgi:integrase
MPRKDQMSWEGSPNFRWVKLYKGVRYRITCKELGAQVHTKDATRALANEWWLRKKEEIGGATAHDETEAFVDSILDGPPEGDAAQAHQLADELMEGFVGVTTYKKAVEALEAGLARPAKVTERSVKANGESFLEVEKGDMKPLSYRELRQYVQSLYAEGGPLQPDDDVNILHEGTIERVYLQLRNSKLSPGAKKKRWGFFRRFTKFVWSRRLIELPRNLDAFSFQVQAQEIELPSPEEVREALNELKPRLQLYCLLGLNCGMLSADVGQLRKDQIDLRKGTLTRKREKTAANPRVPKVTYKLWPTTLALLRECWSEHPTLALTSMDGTPLWESKIEGDKTPQKDLIHQQLKRAGAKLTMKQFRSIAASYLETSEIYGRYTSYYLGHAPRSIADKHYVLPSQQRFDDAISWLHSQLFPSQKKS